MATKVVHCKKEPYDLLIDRTTPWGNPFTIRTEEDLPIVIELFRMWVATAPSPEAAWIRNNIHNIKGKTLGCWCHPKPCHGDVLARMADGIV